ncbi:MAG: hypothetical protein E7143_01225 [Rikenellaceae bacterium]|nr:hypothetical protein [Rikenellaceae bacterium]
MKNIFRFLMAVAVLFTASCAKEDISSSIVGGGEVEMTFTVDLPELGTRANTYGNGANATLLRYYVFDAANGAELEALRGTATRTSGNFTFTLPLLKGMKYNIALWADKNVGTAEAPQGFYAFDGKVVTVNYVNANDNDRDAFYHYEPNFDPTNPRTTTFTLYRPFAQLNAAVSAADKEAVDKNEVTLTTSTVTVDTYTGFDISTGDVTGNKSTVTFEATTMPCNLNPAEELKSGYTYVSMNYLLVPKAGMVSNVTFTLNATKNGGAFAFTGTSYNDVPLKQNFRTNILGALLTKPTDFTVTINPVFTEPAEEIVSVNASTASELKNAIENAEEGKTTEITLGGNIDLSDLTRATDNLVISAENADVVINGNGYTLTYKGSDRAIDVTNQAVGTNLTLKNITLKFNDSYCQRGINYNTNGTLTLDGVTLESDYVTYAVNLPGGSDNAKVEIKDSNITGVIALNVWGENVVVNAVNSDFTSVDKATHENYAAIKLNNDGTGNAAENSVINIEGGSIIAYDENDQPSAAVTNSTATGVVNISDTTYVVGDVLTPIAAVYYDGYNEFYGCYTIEDAIERAIESNASGIRLLSDVNTSEPIAISSSVNLDGNGKTLTYSGTKRAIGVTNGASLSLKDITLKFNDSYCERGINFGSDGTLTLDGVTLESDYVTYAVNLSGASNNAKVEIKDSNIKGLIALNVWGEDVVVNAEGSNFTSVDKATHENYTAIKLNNNGTTSAERTVVNIVGGSITALDENGNPSVAVGNATLTAEVNISESTVVTGIREENEAIVRYAGYSEFYTEPTIQAAIAKATNDPTATVVLLRNIELSETLNIDGTVVIDLNGKTVTAPASSAFKANEGGKLTIKNGKVVAYESVVRAVGGEVIIESGEYTQTGTAVDSPSTYRYAIDSREGGKITINGGEFKSGNGMFNVGSEIVVNGGKFENIVEKSTTRHFAYVSALITINDGEFYGKANSSAGGCFFCGAADGGDIQVKGGKFTSLWTSGSVNRIFESYYGGTINVTGGLFNTNGGIATFVTENTDAATKDAYPYVAK